MADIAQLRAVIGADTHDFERGLGRAQTRMEQFAKSVGGVGRGLSIGLTLPLVGFGQAAIRSATQMDSLMRGLTAVAGSSEEAERQLARLQEIAKLPGLGEIEAIQASTSLQAAGLSAEMAERSLLAFGNALATVGKGKAELDGVSLALTQIISKGKVSAEEINQIAERVPQIRRAMLAAFGTANTEVLQKANLSARQFIEGITRELLKLPKATGGAANSFENLQQSVNRSLGVIGRSVLPTVTQLAERLEAAIKGLTKSWQSMEPSVRQNILVAAGFAAAAGPVLAIVGRLIVPIRTLIAVLGALRAAFMVGGVVQAASLAIASLGGPITLAITAAAGLALAWATNWGSIRDITASAIDFITTAVSEFAQGISTTWAGVTDIMAGQWARGWEQIKEGVLRSFHSVSEAASQAGERDAQRTVARLRAQAPVAAKAGTAMTKAFNDATETLGKKAKHKLSELEQQQKSFAEAMLSAERRLRVAQAGGSEALQQLAGQYMKLKVEKLGELVSTEQEIQGINKTAEARRKATEDAKKQIELHNAAIDQATAQFFEANAAGTATAVMWKMFGEAVLKANPEITRASQILNVLNKEQQGAAESIHRWQEATAAMNETIAARDRLLELRLELEATRTSSDEMRRAIEMFPVAFKQGIAAGKSFQEVFAGLRQDQLDFATAAPGFERQIAAIERQKEAMRSLAQQTQGVFSQALLNLNQGLGSFFSSLVQGFDQMLRQMAADFLASQLTQLVMGAFKGGFQFLGGVGAQTAQIQAATAQMAAQLVTSLSTGGATAAAQVGAAMGAGAATTATAIGTSTLAGGTQMATQFTVAGLTIATTIATEFLAAGTIVAAQIAAAMAIGQAAGAAAAAQHGAMAAPGQPFLVGEAGPELFVPRTAGEIVPNDRTMAGARPIVVNVSISTPDIQGFRRSQSQVAAEMGRAVKVAMARNGQG